MSMNKRPGFFSRLLAVLTGAGKHPLQDAEETSPPSEESKTASVGLPGTQWVFGCSAGAASEVVAGYDQAGFPDAIEGVTGHGFPSIRGKLDNDKKQISSDDYWTDYESAVPDPYK